MHYNNFSQIFQVILEKKHNFIGFAIFSYGGHLGSSTRLNFIALKSCILVNAVCEILEP